MSDQINEAPQEFAGRLTKERDWREIVAWVGDLPPMPQVASRAMSLVENPDTTANELTELLSNDVALVARVLKIANSAMFSRQREITTLNQAIMVIGFKALKGIIVAATLRQLSQSFGNLEKLIWESSMCTAVCASLLAKRFKKRYVEEIFLLGLLHNLGQVVLLVQPNTNKDYKLVLKLIKEKSLEFIPAEQEVYGFGNTLIGALVAKKWNFNPDTCQVILHHGDQIDDDTLSSELDEKIALVQLASKISHAAGVGNPEGYPVDMAKIYAVSLLLGIDSKKLEGEIQEIIQLTSEQFQNERHVYE